MTTSEVHHDAMGMEVLIELLKGYSVDDIVHLTYHKPGADAPGVYTGKLPVNEEGVIQMPQVTDDDLLLSTIAGWRRFKLARIVDIGFKKE